MINKTFGTLLFNTGWKAPFKITFLDKNFNITLKVQAYFEKDGITKEQEYAFEHYKRNESKIRQTIDQLIKAYDVDAKEHFTPTILLFERNGAYTLLCDNNIDSDNDIAICIQPELKIVLQEEYL